MAHRPRIIQQERSRSSFRSRPAGPPTSLAGSSPTLYPAISARNLWWRMSGVPGWSHRNAPRALARRPMDTPSFPVILTSWRYIPRSICILGLRSSEATPSSRLVSTADPHESLVARKDFPANNFKEFVAYAEIQSGIALCLGTPGSARYPISVVSFFTRRSRFQADDDSIHRHSPSVEC